MFCGRHTTLNWLLWVHNHISSSPTFKVNNIRTDNVNQRVNFSKSHHKQNPLLQTFSSSHLIADQGYCLQHYICENSTKQNCKKLKVVNKKKHYLTRIEEYWEIYILWLYATGNQSCKTNEPSIRFSIDCWKGKFKGESMSLKLEAGTGLNSYGPSFTPQTCTK